MREKDITILLQKADELKALFVLGQRVIPFLEEIFIFVRDITPLLDEINTSIEDNLKKMPKASKQLSKVTEANEMATTEIMDIIDGIVYKIDIISGNFKKLQELEYKSLVGPFALLDLINRATKKDSNIEEILPEIVQAIQELKIADRPEREFDDIVSGSLEMLNSIRNDSDGIMMSLQVQDISSQQIAAVNHLLEAVQGKLFAIMNHFRNTEIGELLQEKASISARSDKPNISHLHRDIAFDPDAVEAFNSELDRQGDVDQIISDSNSGVIDIHEPATQDDIDALFSGGNIDFAALGIPDPATVVETPKIEKEPVSPAPLSTEDDLLDDFSQDDIDALFAGNN